ncbi:MAG: 3,4-dihydroxy-2-butanone-4-phosphate synthase [Alphaproteobacteria bacterium]|jgi:3,4-dihydroxy 2-butanone 4-phosphate synthase / GTP cyclohydrolase II|nr:3,4-dihydroxy-2-butanone-4-phosphate synthase [Alphaproteobacteria bacterium]MBT4711752.1 3,4-dihydroxy-2-butanone-4-phosphate synthase [Alphaproteobacteria bacterium]
MTVHDFLSPVDEVIADIQQGRMVILVDDEGRENEGDLIVAGEKASADAVNFMAKHGRGLICLALAQDRVETLELPLMSQHNQSRHQTAFTVSIEAREGVTTGISAADRARTIAAAIDPKSGKDAIQSPGHVFPLVARNGGVLVRAGHTEAAVDLARLAGLNPSGVICEIMNDDGTMARLPELVEFAQIHGLKVATIAELISYRRRNDSMVRRLVETDFTSRFGGEFRMVVYENTVEYAEHIALVKGDLSGPDPVLVRMHALNVLSDVLGDNSVGEHREKSLSGAMAAIDAEGRGVVVLIREPRPTTLSDALGVTEDGADGPKELREYGIGAQILLDLGVKDMILLSNSQRTVVGLEGYRLTIKEQRPITPMNDPQEAPDKDV